tara:strand:+ start:2263 stop:3279 length:1017 start_codon:yes stop_codon:yes gene_type:complete
MRNDTRIALNRFADRVATLNGMQSAGQTFAVEPTVQQTLESKIQETDAFLARTNSIGVDDIVGEKVKIGVSGPIAGRTDVNQNDRKPRDVHALDNDKYQCESTEYDTHVRWATLDAWSKFPDFQTRLRNAIIKQQALDMLMIGFNGTHAATETDRLANPLLQDVNIGWLQQYRNNAPGRVLSEGATAGKISIGAGGDYANLDALVYDAVNELIEPWYRESTDLVVIVGRKLMADKYLPLINEWEQPTEHRALQTIINQSQIGGKAAARVPFVPDRSILITDPANLSRYWQRGSRRRRIVDQPERKRVANFESSNDAYVVEDYGYGCLIENIEMPGDAA